MVPRLPKGVATVMEPETLVRNEDKTLRTAPVWSGQHITGIATQRSALWRLACTCLPVEASRSRAP